MMEFDKEAVGRVIKQLRKTKGVSQEVCSGFAGIARSHLAMIESGCKQPNLETIWRIAGALELAPHSLVELIELETAKKHPENADA